MSDDTARSSPQPRDVCAPRSSPNSTWVCSYAELGKCCALGPTSKGRCGRAETAECDDTAEGDEELAPCIPRRGDRWRRQSLCINLAILTGGLLLLCMTFPSREKAFVPGELSGKHAQILDNTLVSQRCALCHPNSHVGDSIEQGLATLGGRVLGSGASKTERTQAEPGNERGRNLRFFGGDDGRQDALCMQCHQGHMPGALKRTPHDLSPQDLRALADPATGPAWRSVAARPADTDPLADTDHLAPAKTNCAQCHVEHHGRAFDLKAMADDRCQACHRRKFESFADGHPEFKSFPAARPRSFAFSHQAHADKHFPQKNRNFDCRRCHVDLSRSANVGPVTRSVSFETACAECHQAPIEAATAGGWAVLQLPSIQAAAAGKGSPLEHWPTGARFGYEGTISPVLRALLEADEAARPALSSLPESGELGDIPALGDRREQVAKSLAIASEQLIRETALRGQAAWLERLTKVTRARAKRELNARELALIEAMCAGLPPDLFRQMVLEWFDRRDPLAERKSAENASASPRTKQTAGSMPSAPSRQWPAPQQSLHRHPQPNMHGIVVERNTSGLLVRDLLDQNETLLDDGPEDSAADSDALLDDALLNDSDLSDERPDSLGATSATQLTDVETALSALAQPSSKRARAEVDALQLSGAAHLAGGGWYVDNQTLALRYMPSGHGDKTLAAWNLWWAMFSDSPGRPEPLHRAKPASEMPQAKSIPQQIPGGCIECHEFINSNERLLAESLSLAASWRVFAQPLGVKAFTKFDHAPHLSLPAVNDCRYCHVLAAQSQDVAPLHRTAPSHERLVSLPIVARNVHPTSEFHAMQLGQCVACHRPSGANSGCLQCHNYHVSAPPQVDAPHK